MKSFLARAINDDKRAALSAAKSAIRGSAEVTAATGRVLETVGEALATVAKAVEGLLSLFDPGPQRTRAQIEIARNDNQRAENADRDRENTNQRNNERGRER